MTGPLILHIETATDICSVALSKGDRQLSLIESAQERSHASLLNSFIRQSVAQAGKELKDLQGLAYALEIPLLATGTLESMASGSPSNSAVRELISSHGDRLLLCPMLDARRMEVYAGFYTSKGGLFRQVSADIIDEESYHEILEAHPVCFFGNGADKCKEALDHPNAHFIDGINPSAATMIALALKKYQLEQFEDVAYFEPFYLKDFIATVPKKKLL